jgi:hypothetical protein
LKRLAITLMLATAIVLLGASAAFAINRAGGPGPDVLIGGPENDVLNGRGGNDVLVGRGDGDLLIGGFGNDRINAVDPGRPEGDVVRCGPGFDRVVVDPSREDVTVGCERVRVG